MRALTLIGAAGVLAVSALAGAANAATDLEIKDAVVRVVVIPEARSDVKVEVVKRNAALPMDMRVDGDTVKIDGNLGRNAIRNCSAHNGKTHVTVRDKGDINYEDMPQIIVRTPMDVKVRVGGAVFGQIGASGSVNLGNVGCGDWKVADTRGLLRLSQAGSGDVEAGRSGGLEVRIAGSGDVVAGAVATSAKVEIAGSGDVEIASATGDVEARIAGSGDIAIRGGRASRLDASIAGSGDISFDGAVGSVKAQIAGSGDVNVKRVEGAVEKRVMGSGGVNIGG